MYCEGHTCLENSIMKQNYFPLFNLNTIPKQDFCVSEKYAIFLRCIKKISSWCPLRGEEFVTKRPEEASEGFILSVERLAPGLKMPQSQKSKG